MGVLAGWTCIDRPDAHFKAVWASATARITVPAGDGGRLVGGGPYHSPCHVDGKFIASERSNLALRNNNR